MPKPQPVVEDHKDAREDEERVGELDGGEVAEVGRIDDVRGDGEEGQEERKGVEEPEEELGEDDGIDEAGEEFAREDCVFFDEFGEVVEPRRCSDGPWG